MFLFSFDMHTKGLSFQSGSQSSQPAIKHVVDSLAHRDSIAETTVVKVNRNRNGN